MIGMPSPVFKGKQGAPPVPLEASAPNPTREAEAPPGAPAQGKFKGTLLGIAQPGIAPRDPRLDPAPAPPRVTPVAGTPTAPAPESQDAPLPAGLPSLDHTERSSGAPPSAGHFSAPPSSLRPPARPVWQNAVLIGLGLLAAAGIGGLAAALGEKPTQIVVTQYTFNEEGKDQLNLMCPNCPDGTVLGLDGSQATVENEKAVMLTEKTVSIGRNELHFEVKTADGDSLSAKPVILPIAYRQKANWKGRHEASPYAEVVIEAPEGSVVTIDGKPAPMEGTTASARIDLGARTLGEATSTEVLVLAIPMSVTTEGKARKGQATLKNSVTPLQLTSIGSIHELGGKPLTIQGRTAPSATVVVGASRLQADAEGGFSHVIEEPVPGKLIVTSFTDRFVARRVEVLLVSKAVVAEDSVSTFTALEDGVAARIEATVVESRVSNGVTTTLFEMQSGCTDGPCLVRGVFAEPRILKPNRSVRVSGRIQAGDPATIRITKFL